MEYYELLKKLIGSIKPYGDTNIDKERKYNLEEHISLTYKLIEDLIQVSRYRDRPEQSIRDLGENAYLGLKKIREIIEIEREYQIWR